MKYRALGKTGLQISEIVFGAGQVGGLFINAEDETRKAAIRRIVDVGINWIDTAPSYGNGRSEKAISWLLDEIPGADRPHISTKIGLDRAAGDFRGQVERGIHESLDRMKLEKVDLFQVHNSIADSPEYMSDRSLTVAEMLDENGVADALDRVREQGLTDFTGITATGEATAIKRVLGGGRFDTAQVYYNLLNPSAGRSVPDGWSSENYGQLMDTCSEHGVGVLTIRALAAGVIATDIRHGREGAIGIKSSLQADEARMRVVTQLLTDHMGTRAEIAIRYVLMNTKVSGTLVGIAELEHLEQAIRAQELGPLPDALKQQLDHLVDTDFGAL